MQINIKQKKKVWKIKQFAIQNLKHQIKGKQRKNPNAVRGFWKRLKWRGNSPKNYEKREVEEVFSKIFWGDQKSGILD